MVVLQANKFFYEKGGTERYLFLLSEALEERGHRVAHFAMAHPANRPSPWSHHFVSRREYDGAGLAASLRHAGSFIRSGEAARRIDALVAEARPDVAHLHNIYHQLTPSIIVALKRRGIPVVMTLHDYKLVCPNYSLFAKGAFCYRCQGGSFQNAVRVRCSGDSRVRGALLAMEAYWQRWTRVYDAVDCFIAPSRYLRDTIVAAGTDAGRVRHVPGFVDPPGTRGEEPLSPADARVLASLPGRFVVYFGRLSAEKGLETLLEAVARLPEVPLVVCGDGPEAGRLSALARVRAPERVHFTGFAARALLERIVARAAASVIPSLSPENAPYTGLESAAAGVPLIVSDMGGLPEMAGVVGGHVFAHGDAAALAERIAEVWADGASARERAAGGRATALAHYARARHVAAVEAIYAQVVTGGR
ncbi:MAG: glycosyltransferase, partial [Candidatus Krumholzibacteria bacterium]|nr:glycosyltransferase [Candidatus Krumholzibacteria bacterium]